MSLLSYGTFAQSSWIVWGWNILDATDQKHSIECAWNRVVASALGSVCDLPFDLLNPFSSQNTSIFQMNLPLQKCDKPRDGKNSSNGAMRMEFVLFLAL